MALRRTSAFCSSERQEVTSRMLASRILGLKTFDDDLDGVGIALGDDEASPMLGWAL